MDEHTPASALPDDVNPLYALASALAREPETCQFLCTRLMWYATDHDLAQALRDVAFSFTEIPAHSPEAREAIARLERERAHFVDPNRPGE